MTAAVHDAQAALAAKQAAERDLACLSLCPPWRHAVFAGIMAMLVAAQAAPLAWRFPLIVAALGAVALVVRSDRRRLGMFINGYRRGRTRWVVAGLLAAILPLYALAFHAAVDRHRPDLALGLAVVVFGVAYGGSVLWQRVFVRELRG